MGPWPQANPLVKDWFDVEPGKRYSFPNPAKSTEIHLSMFLRFDKEWPVYPATSGNGVQFELTESEIRVQCGKEGFFIYDENGQIVRRSHAQLCVCVYPMVTDAIAEAEGQMLKQTWRCGL